MLQSYFIQCNSDLPPIKLINFIEYIIVFPSFPILLTMSLLLLLLLAFICKYFLYFYTILIVNTSILNISINSPCILLLILVCRALVVARSVASFVFAAVCYVTELHSGLTIGCHLYCRFFPFYPEGFQYLRMPQEYCSLTGSQFLRAKSVCTIKLTANARFQFQI